MYTYFNILNQIFPYNNKLLKCIVSKGNEILK